ncbi:hypothetical protein OIU74_025155 [Salix koriyanagi]|uniref:Uncharacterized protein n=1 Tax=Salix koriyanagi TaxID=2511006 RepID=A0A9Q1A4X3_9ROSI|nr:hypothetical protein OIU74_025155 [Salix koriyanagi]
MRPLDHSSATGSHGAHCKATVFSSSAMVQDGKFYFSDWYDVKGMLPPHDPPTPIIMDSSIITDRHSRCFWPAIVKYSPPPRRPFPPSHL